MQLANLQVFGGEGCLESACCSWHQHSVNSGPPSGIFIHTQTAFLQFPPQLCFPGEFTTNQHFNIPHITSAFWKDPSGKKKKRIILLVFESSSSLPSPSSPSSLVPASWRRKEHINPKTALQPFLHYLPWGANWNWIRQGYQVCSLW